MGVVVCSLLVLVGLGVDVSVMMLFLWFCKDWDEDWKFVLL